MKSKDAMLVLSSERNIDTTTECLLHLVLNLDEESDAIKLKAMDVLSGACSAPFTVSSCVFNSGG